MFDKIIRYDRETRDYRMELDGALIGFARTYHEAEVTLDQTVFEMLIHGDFATATELDGGIEEGEGPGGIDLYAAAFDDDGAVECSEPDNHCAVHNPCPVHAADAARYLADGPMLMPEGDWLDVEGLRVVAPAGLVVVQVALDPPESLREDCLNVITMTLNNRPAKDMIPELRRIKARLQLERV